jgi:RNA ligase (TIGR02306 family)
MNNFRAEVIRIGKIEKHPNADRLGVTQVFGNPVVVNLDEFSEGDLAVYVPVDSIVPENDLRWSFLKGNNRVRVAKIRGVLSVGLLTKADPNWVLGQDVTRELGIKKYEPPEHATMSGDDEPCPFYFPEYPSIKSLSRWPRFFRPGEPVVITEKVRGANARFVYQDGRLWIGSRKQVKRESPDSAYWKVARKYNLEEKLKRFPGIVLYGEVYGWAQDLRYGHKQGQVSLVIFDAMRLDTRSFLDFQDLMELAAFELDLNMTPVLWRGPWREDLKRLAEGPTLLGGWHMRDGIVIRSEKEHCDDHAGRVIFKLYNEDPLWHACK